jgi:hypothetical protein
MKCYSKILTWIEEELDKFPDENIQGAEMVAYATLQLVKQQILKFKESEEHESKI